MLGHTLKHGDELYSLITEGMVEHTRLKRRPRTMYINQIIKDARVTSFK